MTQTAGLALAADRATEQTRAKVVSMLYVMYLVGMGISAVIIGTLLRDYSSLSVGSSGARRGGVHHGFECYCSLEAGKNGADEPGGAPGAEGEFS